MKKVLLILLYCLLYGIKVQAQIPCEFDSIYGLQNNEAGYRLLECKTGGFLLLQMNGHRSSVEADYPVFALTKTDNCGKRIWTTKLDSSQCDAFKPCAKVLNLIEDENGNIECAAYYTAWTITKRAVLLFKTDNNGIMLRKTKVKLDSNLYYNINTFIKINSNRYLFTGSVASFNAPNKPVAFAAMSDTVGNVIFYNRYFSDTTLRSKISNAYQMTNNLILLFGHEDSVLTITKIDTTGNVLDLHKIPMQKPVSLEFNNPTLSYDSSSFFTYKSGTYNFGKFNLNGGLIKETNIAITAQCTGFTNNPIDYFPLTSIQNNNLIIPYGNILIVIDSNLDLLKKDTFTYCIYNAIQTKDSCIAATGSLVYSRPTSLSSYLVLNKTSLVTYVNAIFINGQGSINQNQGHLQLTALVLPSTAKNKNIRWGINDTTIAIINQTGLVRAIKNGNVIVTASTTDGSNIEATKSITITNQGVGLNQISEKNADVVVYPNPASNYINIQSRSIKIYTAYLTDISGKVLYSTNQVLSINVEDTPTVYIY
jgi:hypothetical protein